MKKYIQKKSNEKEKDFIVEVEKAEDDKTIKTQWGEAIVSAGNYIATDKNGYSFGITETDLNLCYSEIK